MQRQNQTKEKMSHCGSLVSHLVQELAIQVQTPVRVTILKVTKKMAIVLYVHSVMCYKDLRATINPYYKPKISEES